MKVFIGRILSTLAILACSLHCAVACAQATRHITVQATVQTSAGQPLENVPLMLLEAIGQPVAKTDAQGHATISGDVLQETTAVTVRVFGGGDESFGSDADQLALAKWMIDLEKQYSFDEFTRISLTPQQDAYSVTVTAWPAVSVSGILVDSSGEPLTTGLATASSSACFSKVDLQGAFTLRGLRQENAAILFLHHGWDVLPVSLSIQQTQANLSLGQVTMPTQAKTAHFRSTLANVASWSNAQESNLVAGVTLVAADGTIVFTELASSQVQSRLRTDPLSLPPGEYYIAPGYFAAGRVQVALVRACEQGMNLDGTGIPKVTLVAGQTVDVEVDLFAAYNAIRDHIGFE